MRWRPGAPTKVAYDTAAIAAKVKARCEGKRGVPLRVYACPYGPHHHLTSRFKPQERCGAYLEPYEATGPDD